MKIEQIRAAETILFWIEKAAIFIFVFFGGIPRFLHYSAELLTFTNLSYASLAYERLFVTPQPKEPSNTLFIFDRYASWLVVLHFFMGSPVYRYVAAAIFVISNMNLIMTVLGVDESRRIFNCIPTDRNGGKILSKLVEWHKSFKNFDYLKKDDKEQEIEKPLAVEELAEEKTKLDEIKEIPETETIEPEAYYEKEVRATLVEDNIIIASNKEEDDGEEDYEMVSYEKDCVHDDEDDKHEHGSDDDGEDYCGNSDDEDEEEDCCSSNDDDGECDRGDHASDKEEDCDSSDDNDGKKGMIETDSLKENRKTEETQENVQGNEKEVKEQELKKTGDEHCCKLNRAFLSSMQREARLLKEQNELNELLKDIVEKLVVLEKELLNELLKDIVEKLVVLEKENAVLSRKLSAEITSSTEQLNRIMYEYERKCQRLEEEKVDLNASLSTAKAESDFYRECMHNLGLDDEQSSISTLNGQGSI